MLYSSGTSCYTENSGCNKCMKGITVLVGIVSGIIFGAIYTSLYIFFQLPLAFAGVLTALIIATLFLFIVLISGVIGSKKQNTILSECICCNFGSLFFGILGTIIFGVLAISSVLFPLSVITIILVALTAFFFAYMLVTILFLVRCLICR